MIALEKQYYGQSFSTLYFSWYTIILPWVENKVSTIAISRWIIFKRYVIKLFNNNWIEDYCDWRSWESALQNDRDAQIHQSRKAKILHFTQYT